MTGEELASVTLPCPRCGRPGRLPWGALPPEHVCQRCRERLPLAGGKPAGEGAPEVCVVCRSPFLYWQKDFNQKWGCLFVALGAAFVPWTYGMSLAVVAAIDLVLYRLLPRVSVCYVCKARYKGLVPHPRHEPYSLITAQTFEARAQNWAAGSLRPAFTEAEAASPSPAASH